MNDANNRNAVRAIAWSMKQANANPNRTFTVDLVELRDMFDVAPATLRAVIARDVARFQAKGWKVTYDKGTYVPSGDRNAPAGSMNHGTSRRILASISIQKS